MVCLNTRVAHLQIFFAYYFFTFDWFRSSRLVSIEGDRRLEGSSAQHAMCIYAVGVYTYGICGGTSAQHANVYLRSRRIHLRDIVVVMGFTT